MKSVCMRMEKNSIFSFGISVRLFLILFVIPAHPQILSAQCQQSYNWTTWTTFTPNSATGTVLFNGQPVNVTMSANYTFSSTSDIYNYAAFNNFFAPPPNSKVPQTTWAIGQGGQTKMCFSSQVENPVLVLASLGNVDTKVTLTLSRPYILVYDGGGNTFPNDTTIIGKEGYSIIKFPGKFDCVTLFSNDSENYTNITFGLNPQTFPVSVVRNPGACRFASYTASGGKKYAWSGGLYKDSSTNVFTSRGTYILTVTDDRGCTVNTSVDVVLDSASALNLTKGPKVQEVCVNSDISPIEYQYDLSSSSVSVSGLPPGVTYSQANGLLRISGRATDTIGSPYRFIVTTISPCGTQRDTGSIKVNTLPRVDAGPDKRVPSGTLIRLEGQAWGNIQRLQWSPALGLSDPTILTPSIKMTQSTEFTLTATSLNNCTASDKVLIQVLNEIIPPNVFSPNADGINDKWIIQDIDAYKDIEVKIFNRYGVLLLDRKGYDSSNAWDGTHNGRALPVGAYFYVIRTSDDKILKGTVSIIR